MRLQPKDAMRMPPEPCQNPDLDLLRRAVQGEFEGDIYDEIEAHVESCPACQRALDLISPDDFPTIKPQAEEMEEGESPLPSVPGYRITGVIGRGGMGVIYRAEDIALMRVVAVKILRSKFVTGERSGEFARFAARFEEEARITGQLQHPGIPAVPSDRQAGRRTTVSCHETCQGPHPR